MITWTIINVLCLEPVKIKDDYVNVIFRTVIFYFFLEPKLTCITLYRTAEGMHSMKLGLVAVITVSVVAGMLLLNNYAMQANAQGNATASQSGALLGYGGQIFGLVDVSTNDHLTKINVASDFLPPAGKVFEVWMVDGNYAASGYPLSLGQISPTGTLKYNENLVYAPTYTDIVITVEPQNDKDPKPAWSQSVAGYWMIPPFGQ